MSQDTFTLSIEEARAVHGLLDTLARRGYDDVKDWAGPLHGLYARLGEPGVLRPPWEETAGRLRKT